MSALSKLICALVLAAFLLAGVGLLSTGTGSAGAQEKQPGAVAQAPDKDKDRCIHKLCRELEETERLARRCLREEEKEKDRRDVARLKAIIRHLEDAIKECRRADKD